MAAAKRAGTSKNPNKLKKVATLFSPRSFKGGMTLFVLVFAVAGGGYFVYRSFAATTSASIADVVADNKQTTTIGASTCPFAGSYKSVGAGDIRMVSATKADYFTSFSIATGSNIDLTKFRYTIALTSRGTLKSGGCVWGGNYYVLLQKTALNCSLRYVKTSDANSDGKHGDFLYVDLGSTDCITKVANNKITYSVRNAAINDWSKFNYKAYVHAAGNNGLADDVSSVGYFEVIDSLRSKTDDANPIFLDSDYQNVTTSSVNTP